MDNNLPLPNLGMSPEEADKQFQLLQKKLVPLWKSIQSFNQDEQTIVVVPSMSIDMEFSGSALQAYEERFLFLLFLLLVLYEGRKGVASGQGPLRHHPIG